MTAFASDIPDYELKAARRDQIVLALSFTIGASGAVASTDSDDAAVTVTKGGGTGQYAITFPASKNAKAFFQLESVAKTVSTVDITAAISASAGTLTIVTGNAAGTATNPASGDVVHVLLLLRKRDES